MTPALTVVMTARNARATIVRALASVEPQRDGVNLELVLVDSSTDGTDELVRQQFPWVRVLHYTERKFCGDGRNIGIAQSTAPVIAFLDADCEAAPDWAQAILAAHAANPALAIGGAIDNANPDEWFGWSYYFTEFAAWAPGMPAGEVDDIPGCSLSIKRNAFNKFGPFLEGTYCSDSAFLWALSAAGHRPVFDPTIRVSHINPANFRHIIHHAASHGRQFGRVRREQQRPGSALLTAWRFGAPVLPALLFGRTARNVLRSKSAVGRFLVCAPAVFMVQAAWSLGECASYWAAENSVGESVEE